MDLVAVGSPRRAILQSLKEAKTSEVSGLLIRFHERFFQKLEVRERLGLHCSAPFATALRALRATRLNAKSAVCLRPGADRQ